jgi:LAO/AO transport system kinase
MFWPFGAYFFLFLMEYSAGAGQKTLNHRDKDDKAVTLRQKPCDTSETLPEPPMDISDIAEKITAGDRRALARAITLVESTRAEHRVQALELADRLRGADRLCGGGRQALRIGLSGTPGVGKSTFIECFGLMLVAQGLRVAVLAVDPSSARSGGSILGDKTRMERLSREPMAFIRPSPSQTHLGGVARRTREAVALCEAAGFDVVLIETVGVGQSETVVAELSDLFILLLAPAGGDELQGVKRGIMEMADIILVNKADGDLKAAAMRTCADYAGALRLLRRRPQDPDGFPKAMTVSALELAGLETAWAEMQNLRDWRQSHGHWATRRATQARHWFEDEVRQGLLRALTEQPKTRAAMVAMGAAVARGEMTPDSAAAEMLRNLAAKA